MKMYKTNSWAIEVVPFEATRKTESSVFFMRHGKEERAALRSNYDNYHVSELAAWEFLRDIELKELNRLKTQTELAEGRLGVIQEKMKSI